MASFKRADAGVYALTSTRADGYLVNCEYARRYTLATAIIATHKRQVSRGDYRPNSDKNGPLVTIKPVS